MKRAVVVLAALGLLTGCGGEDERIDETKRQATAQPKPRLTVGQAIEAHRELAAGAAADLAGVGDMDLLPSERGAEYLVESGYIDAERFCAVNAVAFEAETDPEAEAAFEAGWAETAPAGIRDMGATMYNALWAVYCLGA